MSTLHENAASQIIARCRELSNCTEVAGETTRLHLCPPMQQVHAMLRSWMAEAGLTVRLDGAGNLRGLRASRTDKPRTLLIGSHLDTVPNAGAFDGILGVVLGLGAIELLREEQLPYSIELIGFAEEEGVRFGRPFLGSLALTGELTNEVLGLKDRDGLTVRESLLRFGAPVADLATAVLPPDSSTLGFVEVHIEQGPVLENASQGLGVVHTIAGQTRARLRFAGQANHAGTTPMALRHDALAAAAAWVTQVEQHARAIPGLVATVGQLTVEPGAANVIPARAVATLDVRHADDAVRNKAVDQLLSAATAHARERGVGLAVEVSLNQPAVAMDVRLATLLELAAVQSGATPLRMVSGAGHDAMVLARRVPAAMLFLRSPGGLSHHPDETVLLPDVAAALETTIRFLRLLGDDEASTKAHEG